MCVIVHRALIIGDLSIPVIAVYSLAVSGLGLTARSVPGGCYNSGKSALILQQGGNATHRDTLSVPDVLKDFEQLPPCTERCNTLYLESGIVHSDHLSPVAALKGSRVLVQTQTAEPPRDVREENEINRLVWVDARAWDDGCSGRGG